MDPAPDLPAPPEAHSAPAANPTPNSSVKQGPAHPPYAEMITAAIDSLKERSGSSKRAIANFISTNYQNLPSSHSALLTFHLKRLKDSGVLYMIKHSYKLNASRSTAPAASAAAVAAAAAAASGMKRSRGRPRKPKPSAAGLPDASLVALGCANEPLPVSVVAPVALAPKRRPGRPRKVKAGPPAGLGLDGTPKKRPGRPPKFGPVSGGAGLGSAVVKRSRGRPRKEGTSPAAAVAAQLVAQSVPGKRRGRPPRLGVTRRPKRLTGKPVGRPRKSVGQAGTNHQPPRGQLENPVDLKLKLEHFQLKIKQAVGVLKPHLMNDHSVSLALAIQDLEQLAEMDITAPFVPPFVPQDQQQVQQGQYPVLEKEG